MPQLGNKVPRDCSHIHSFLQSYLSSICYMVWQYSRGYGITKIKISVFMTLTFKRKQNILDLKMQILLTGGNKIFRVPLQDSLTHSLPLPPSIIAPLDPSFPSLSRHHCHSLSDSLFMQGEIHSLIHTDLIVQVFVFMHFRMGLRQTQKMFNPYRQVFTLDKGYFSIPKPFPS